MPQQESTAAAGLKVAAPRWLYFAIFAVSGFSGLIYESIWSHYLKLFLGHAAYAQSLVLIIFMGGMAAGSFIASRFSHRSKSPILIYAAVEAIVGLAALVFHNAFTGVVDLVYSALLPAIGAPMLGATVKWLAASLLIIPQSVLLGMTFPLMSAGIIRRYPDTPGGSIAMLYFTNSIGAAIGVLASGFWLIKTLGLPGTILTAGLLNIALALVVWVLVRLDPKPDSPPLPLEEASEGTRSMRGLFIIAAFITGAASFIYEISWIRMLSLVLGATTHSFELMLSAFITGLAFGGLWIKRRIDRVGDPVRFSAFVQLIMGVCALLTIPVYMLSYDWMNGLLEALQRNDAGFAGFNLASHAIALAVMLPTTFMAGMTLPLFTYVLIRRGDGEASIGRIYAANTLGAIVGVIFAVHVGLPQLGLKNLIVLGAALDIGLAIVLLQRAERSAQYRFGLITASVAGIAAIVVTLSGVEVDKKLLMSGVYRGGDKNMAMQDEVLFYRDGKTASVSLRKTPQGLIVLATNGKPDASIQTTPGLPAAIDEVTMTLAGTLPFAFKPDARHVANIGMGSGQTTHVLLGNDRVETVDTVEIEVEMQEASRGFGDAVARAHSDPRSRIFIEDAKTYFSLHNSVYDIIIAEPSNPWVSGVASLFSTEFYATVMNHLEDDGLFVQWIQLYEFSDDLAESILKALSENFSDYAIYAADSVDLLIIARKSGELPEPDWDILRSGKLAESLDRVGVHTVADLAIRKMGDRRTLVPYLDLVATPTNSDYYPFVDLNAGRARYVGGSAASFSAWAQAPLPVLELLHDNPIDFSTVSPSAYLMRNQSIQVANWVYEKLMGDDVSDPEVEVAGSISRVRYLSDWLLLAGAESCQMDANPTRWRESIHSIAVMTLPYLEGRRGSELMERLFGASCRTTAAEQTRLWGDVYASIAARDGLRMAMSGKRLLAYSESMSEADRAYLVASTMLGEVASGRAADAYKTWTIHGQPLFTGEQPPEYVKLILSIAVEAASAAEAVARQ